MAREDEPSYDRLDIFPTKMRATGRRGVVCHDVAILLLGVVAVIALVFSAVALSRGPGTASVKLYGSSGSCTTGDDDKIWVFAIGHDGTNKEYIDQTSGTLRGFHVDIVEAVCGVANKNCRLMWDVYENCYTSKVGERPRPGVGLVSRWYDGCTGWFATYERIASVSFTKPFRKPIPALFYVKRGNPGGFNSSDLTGKTIGFFDGASTSEFCLYRAGFTEKDLPAENIRHYASRGDILKAVNDGVVDAVFANTLFFTLGSDLDAAGGPIATCEQDGAGIMVRKDSKVPDWWNPAFDQLKLSTEYEKICSEVTEKHSKPDPGVDCMD